VSRRNEGCSGPSEYVVIADQCSIMTDRTDRTQPVTTNRPGTMNRRVVCGYEPPRGLRLVKRRYGANPSQPRVATP
jgi:hypothetical protein